MCVVVVAGGHIPSGTGKPYSQLLPPNKTGWLPAFSVVVVRLHSVEMPTEEQHFSSAILVSLESKSTKS